MTYGLYIKPDVDKTFLKLSKKDSKQLAIIRKKLADICENPNRYKNLRAPLNAWKEVHIDSHFVLAFSVNEKFKRVEVEYYDHHDKIFK
jgi:YafQ family addiction module toxin component